MKIIVQLGAGDKLDPNVLVDKLIGTVGVGTEKGRKYLYDIAWDEKMYTLLIPFRSVFKPSDIVSISDASLGSSFIGRVNGITVSGIRDDSGFYINMTLKVDRKIIDG